MEWWEKIWCKVCRDVLGTLGPGKMVLEGIGQGCTAWKREGKSETKKAGLDAPALAGHAACSSDTHKWQLQFQVVAIAPSQSRGAAELIRVYIWRQLQRCGITQLKKYVQHKAGRSNTESLLFCGYIEPFNYGTRGCWGRQAFVPRARLSKTQPIAQIDLPTRSF